MTVLAVQEWAPKDDPLKKRWYVKLEGHENDVPCYDAIAADLKIGEPLPAGWEVATSKAGKPYLKTPQSKGGFNNNFRNTAEGQFYEQERMDRRTALMQAVAMYQTPGLPENLNYLNTPWHDMADLMYAWLRKTSPGSIQSSSQETAGGNSSEGQPPATSSPVSTAGETTGSGTGTAGGTTSGAGGAAKATGGGGEAPQPPASGHKKWADDAWAGMPGMEG